MRRAVQKVLLQGRSVRQPGGGKAHQAVAPGLDLDPEIPDQKAAEDRAELLPEPPTTTITQIRKVKRNG